MGNKTWEMNAVQKEFVEAIKGQENGITLFELKLAGKEFKSGSINALLTKGIVENIGEKEFVCDVVFNGVVVGKSTKKGALFRLVARP